MPGVDRSFIENSGQCQDRCAHTDGCAHFTVSVRDGACTLQNSSAVASPAEQSIAGPPNCDELGCVAHSTRFLPDMPGGERTVLDNAMACRQRCRSLHGCQHYSYWPLDGGCMLQNSSGRRKHMPDAIAGTPYCPACSSYGVKYTPSLSANRTWTDGPEACQEVCRETPGCAYFSYWPETDGRCLLQGDKAKHSLEDGVVSGPRVCAGSAKTIPPASAGAPSGAARDSDGGGAAHHTGVIAAAVAAARAASHALNGSFHGTTAGDHAKLVTPPTPMQWPLNQGPPSVVPLYVVVLFASALALCCLALTGLTLYKLCNRSPKNERRGPADEERTRAVHNPASGASLQASPPVPTTAVPLSTTLVAGQPQVSFRDNVSIRSASSSTPFLNPAPMYVPGPPQLIYQQVGQQPGMSPQFNLVLSGNPPLQYT
eukprot:NODE_1893_length_2343_cov_5.107852.p1 GENE.NODE_1893_length_2343_cov_5.107852~~NODE_1893_length_2343_cov_5.107852.p1  ORF type:complete len:428 (-),score=59.08 NODE_1893_length_2343_cov_5.107852:513-1796(-)